MDYPLSLLECASLVLATAVPAEPRVSGSRFLQPGRGQSLTTGVLSRGVHRTLVRSQQGGKRLHGDLGITAVLHTWGQKLDFHPHLHCIVTGGALSADGKRWRSPKQRKFLLPVRALAALFRGKFLAGLHQMLAARELHLPNPGLKTPATRAGCFSLLYNKPWVVYAKRPSAERNRS